MSSSKIKQYTLFLHPLTPLHVGAASEKHLSNAGDFVIQENTIYLFDQKKIIADKGLTQYCDALAGDGGKSLASLIEKTEGDLKKYSTTIPISGESDTIKVLPRNGLTGRPIIPGSSIKGALSSVISSYLYSKDEDQVTDKNKFIQQTLGMFDKSLMRFIHVTDATFMNRNYFNSKIFNLQTSGNNSWQAGWKHSFFKTDGTFNDNQFTTIYESIEPGEATQFHLRFNQALEKSWDSVPFKAKQAFLDKDMWEVLREMIFTRTKQYIEKEIEFYEKYKLDEVTQKIIAVLKRIEQKNTKENPVLRMASGSGFHSITGDWQYRDHVNTGYSKENIIKYKSRRLAFYKDENESLHFLPFGFVQFASEEYYNKEIAPQIEKRRQQKLKLQQQAKAKEEKIQAQKALDEKKAREPKTRSLQEIKKEGICDVVVTGEEGNFVLFTPFVSDQHETKKSDLRVRYAKGFPNGTILTIRVQVSKNKLTNFSHPRIKNYNHG